MVLMRAAGHPRTRLLVDGHRLAGHHRLVDGAAPLDDDAVHRNLLAGTNAADIADPHLARAARPALRPRGRRAPSPARAEQLPDGRARPAARPQLEHLPEQHERRDDDGRVEIGLDDAVHPEPVGKEPGAACRPRCRRTRLRRQAR